MVALPGTYLSSIGTIVDGFALVAGQIQRMFAAPYRLPMQTQVRILTTSGDRIELAGQRSLSADDDLQTRDSFQLIYLPAFDAADEASLIESLARQTLLRQWLREQRRAQALIGAAGTAVFALAEAGLLDKGIAAVPKELSALFRRRYPRIRLETRAAVAEHEGIFTAGAMTAEWQLVAKLVERTMSPYAARWLATTTGLQRTRDNSPDMSEDPLVAAAQFWLGERFAQNFRIGDMARELAVSHSTLIRRFEHSLSMTPRHYAQMLRVESAKSMLTKTNRSIDQISTMVGYADTRSFRTAFREHVGMSPTGYRSAVAE